MEDKFPKGTKVICKNTGRLGTISYYYDGPITGLRVVINRGAYFGKAEFPANDLDKLFAKDSKAARILYGY